jgi:hypothetical protein
MSRLCLVGAGPSNNGSSLFNSALGGTLAGYWDAHVGSLNGSSVYPSNGNTVGTVTMQADSGAFLGDMVQGTDASRPTFVSSCSPNGKGGLNFAGTASEMRLSSSLNLFNQVATRSHSIVINFNAVSKDQTFCFVVGTTGGSNRLIIRAVAANTLLVNLTTLTADAGGFVTTGAFTISAATWYHIATAINYGNGAGKVNMWVNGVQRITNGVPTGNTTGNTEAASANGQQLIGRDDGAARWLDAKVLAQGWYTTEMNATQAGNLYSAYQTYYGI